MPENPGKKRGKDEVVSDINREFAELAGAQDKKINKQTHGLKGLKGAEKKVLKEAGDILRIARECSEDPDNFIVDAIKDYAKSEGTSVLAAKARVLQHISPEWKEKVDREVREYFENFNLFDDFMDLKEGSEELETLKILCTEGYISYFVIVVHFSGDPSGQKHMLEAWDEFRIGIKKNHEDVNETSLKEKEAVVFESSFPSVKKYFEELKKTRPREEYEHLIDLTFKYTVWAFVLRKYLGQEYDCDESTLLLQKLAMDNGLEIGNYIHTRGHAVLRLDGSDLVLDTADYNIRTIDGCARKEGYGDDETGYFWRSDKEEYLAQYSEGEGYPKKIIGYKKVEKNPSPIPPYHDMAALLWVVARDLWENRGYPVEAEKFYKKILEINPDISTTHGAYGDFLSAERRRDEAARHWKKAVQLESNNLGALYNYADVLGDQGRYDEAAKCYERLLKLDPNDMRIPFNYAVLNFRNGFYSKARKYLDLSVEVNGGKTIQTMNLDQRLKLERF